MTEANTSVAAAMDILLAEAEKVIAQGKVREALEALSTAARLLQHADDSAQPAEMVERMGTVIESAVRLLHAHFGHSGWGLFDPQCLAEPSVLRCSFCGKARDEVAELIAGFEARICSECVDLCREILGK